jgi:hypothetical protein
VLKLVRQDTDGASKLRPVQGIEPHVEATDPSGTPGCVWVPSRLPPTFLREWSPSISKFETKSVGRRRGNTSRV